MPVRGPERTTPWAEFILTMQGQPLLLLEDKIPDLRMMYSIRLIHQFPMLFLTLKKSTSCQSWAEPFMSESPQWQERSANPPPAVL
jgi:hypothetical protein